MEPLFFCPPATALTAIPNQDCGIRFDQIQRIAFQRKQATPSFTAASIKVQATWTPLLAATDATKIVLTPRMAALTISGGEPLYEGGNDNSTINGVRQLRGIGASNLSGNLQDVRGTILAAIRALVNESSGDSNIWAYFINIYNQIIAESDGAGIDVSNIIAGDPSSAGFGAPNISLFSLELPPGWFDAVDVFNATAPFKPLTF